MLAFGIFVVAVVAVAIVLQAIMLAEEITFKSKDE